MPPTDAGSAALPRRRAGLPDILAALGLLAIVLALYRPALDHGFVDYDDPEYVTQNPRVLAGLERASVRWGLGAFVAGNWHPLTLLSHMLDVELFGLDPWGHHLSSVLLHGLCAALLFVVLRVATGARWPPFGAALLFAIHPLQVEPVVWVSQRKTVLAVACLLLSMLAYVGWPRRHWRRDLLVAVPLALGLMAKPILVTAPLGYLLLDLWPLDRLRQPAAGRRFLRLLLEKLPFFALAAVAALVTLRAQGAAIEAVAGRPALDRLANAIVGTATNLRRVVWPHDLAVLYPYRPELPLAELLLSALLLLALTTLAVQHWRRRPYLLFGWCWFLVHLAPTSGIVAVGNQATADRYLYLPLIGLATAVVWGGAELHAAGRGRLAGRSGVIAAAPGAVALVITLCAASALGFATRRQIAPWHDTVTLFEHALAVTEGNFVAHQNLGVAYHTRGDRQRARQHLERALALRPDAVTALAAYGETRRAWGESAAAVELLRRAVALAPQDAVLRYSMAMALDDAGDAAGAIEQLRTAVEIEPMIARAHYGLGVLLEGRAESADAVAHYQRAAALDASLPGVHLRLGALLLAADRVPEARGALLQAIERQPATDVVLALAEAFARGGEPERALDLCTRWLESGKLPPAERRRVLDATARLR